METSVPALFDGLLRASWQAAVLVVIVLLLQQLLRRWLAPGWRHALWLLVLARLLLPATPPASWSLYNLAPERSGTTDGPALLAMKGAPSSVGLPPGSQLAPGEGSPVPLLTAPQHTVSALPSAATDPLFSPDWLTSRASGPDGSDSSTSSAAEPGPTYSVAASQAPAMSGGTKWLWILAAVWVFVAALLGGRIVWGSLRFGRGLRSSRELTDPAFHELLVECRQHMCVRRQVAAFETDRITSPALCGWWRPRLLLPAGLSGRLSRDELRHVLLHELAHLKRGDILVNWLATAAQVLHWFNPVVWYALRRLRADRELAADALALTTLGEPHARAYGQTILKLLQGFTRRMANPALAGVVEDKGAMRERIRAIAVFQRPTRWANLAVLLLLGVGLLTLTDAHPRAAVSSGTSEAEVAGAASGTRESYRGFQVLDLAQHYVTRWDTIQPGTSWAAVPKGRQSFAGVPFEAGGLLELSGLGALRDNKRFPTRVEGILVEGKVGALHLLHGAGYDAPDGTPIGKVVLHYADGETRELPIQYGVHVRNWWVERIERSGAVSDPGTRVAWTGTSPETDPWGVTLRLFQTRLPNPRPEHEVTSLDVVSLLARATPVILALTVEPPDATVVGAPSTAVASVSPEPTSLELRLRVVAADSGQALPNASVRLQVTDERTTHAFGEHRADREGRVTLDFPRDTVLRFAIVSRAPGYLLRRDTVAGDAVPDELLLKLEPGFAVSGSVVGAAGQALAGAQIRLACGDALDIYEDSLSDATGRFRMIASEIGAAVVLVQAAGHAPEQRAVQLERGLEPLTFRLTAGRTIEGRVIDDRGLAVAGAVVNLERWQDHDLLAWRAETDAEGRFIWEDAPSGTVTLAAAKAGYQQTLLEVDLETQPRVDLRLTRRFLLTGRVLDAETDQPISSFQLIQGEVWGGPADDDAQWQIQRERPFESADGTFSTTLDSVSDYHVRFMVRAEGYLPDASPALAPSGWHQHTFRLRRGTGPQGIVVDAAGRPVEGAQVALIGLSYVSLADGVLSVERLRRVEWTETDAAGRFTLPALLPDPRLVALHPEHGFAEVTSEAVAATGKIVLGPWGRIEGVMKIGSQVAADREVTLVNRAFGPSDLQFDFEVFKTRTDGEGRFVFPRVPPGQRQLMRPIPMSGGSWTWSHQQPIDVRPGAITTVTYGGVGRPVIGKVIPNDPERKIEWASGHHGLRTRMPRPPAELRSQEDVTEWLRSPEYQEALANHRLYGLTWSEDGRFRVEDVPPGHYDLMLHFVEASGAWPQVNIGSISREIEIPDIPGGQTDEPVNLGELELTLRTEQELAAERARQLEASSRTAGADSGHLIPTLDGGVFEASRVEGKFVLMTLWSATNEASRTELRLLKELHAEYGQDERLLMLGAVMDDDLDPARQLVAELDITWTQMVPRPEIRRDLAQQIPDLTLPASLFMLAGVDAPPRPLRGEAVREAVARALGLPDAPSSRSAAESAAAAPAPLVRDTAPPEMRGVKPRLW